ncbi:hypothetical protein YC2023_089566 [Brassica napus]
MLRERIRHKLYQLPCYLLSRQRSSYNLEQVEKWCCAPIPNPSSKPPCDFLHVVINSAPT